jgi:BirA family biotin operon repressor/biotin-[acetyl-CoA-carboxylase] ligase
LTGQPSRLANLPATDPAVYQVGEVTSALDVAWELIRQGQFPAWSSLLAQAQTQGRGRHGRVWASPPGHVYAALRLPERAPFVGTLASVALGVALAQALGDEGLAVRLKWPNDLLLPAGKAGGILLENRQGALLAGVGLNLGQSPFPVELREPLTPPPAALPLHLGPPAELWPRLVKNIHLRYNDSDLARDPDWARKFSALAESSLIGLGEMVTIHQPVSEPVVPQPHVTGLLIGLAPSGALRLASPVGEILVWSGTLTSPTRARPPSS